MTKKKTVAVACFNIRCAADRRISYIELLESAFKLRKAVHVFGSVALILRTMSRSKSGLDGIISKFTDFDKMSDWINLDNLDIAKASDLREVNIPDNLRPGMKSFNYQFNEINHKLYIQTYGDDGSLSVRQITIHLRNLFREQEIIDEYGEIYITPVTWADDIISMANLINISKFEIFIQPPNPDDIPDLEEEILEKLRKKKAASIKEVFSAADSDGISIDLELEQLSIVASRNGYVSMHGKNKKTGAPGDYKSTDHPATVAIKYDPDKKIEGMAFIDAVDEFKAKERAEIHKRANRQ